ncbi:hypothetical protein HGI15_02730 [Modestobacter lapidis]|nr:hypothetical protein [Modestobacter lapidis]
MSFQDVLRVPSAVLSDGVATVPLWAVTTLQLAETYSLPPLVAQGARATMPVHDDTISLTGLLVGPQRYAFKVLLENLAESSKRGSALATFTGGKVGGLILVTSLTIRTDMQVQSLSFTASAAKREALDVSISMVHVPRPGSLSKLLDLASLGVGGLRDFGAAKGAL